MGLLRSCSGRLGFSLHDGIAQPRCRRIAELCGGAGCVVHIVGEASCGDAVDVIAKVVDWPQRASNEEDRRLESYRVEARFYAEGLALGAIGGGGSNPQSSFAPKLMCRVAQDPRVCGLLVVSFPSLSHVLLGGCSSFSPPPPPPAPQ